MSRTIQTNSGTDFWTNIISEMLLGKLCKEVGCKYFQRNFLTIPTLAFSMTKEEAEETSIKLIELSEKSEKIFKKYQEFLTPDVDFKEFKEIILDYAKMFKDSEGYTCVD
jgi:hypothetical protein